MIFCINNGGLNEVKTRKGELKQFLIRSNHRQNLYEVLSLNSMKYEIVFRMYKR